MDIGMNPEPETTYDFAQTLTPEQVIGIMDHMFACEVLSTSAIWTRIRADILEVDGLE